MKTAATPSTMPANTIAPSRIIMRRCGCKPDFAQALSDRGAAWYFKGEYQKAIADYDEAIRLDPNNARTYTNRGTA